MDDGYSLAFVSSSFARSAEFRARYGSLEDTDFVTLVYRNVLGREPDAEGLRHWVTMLADGRSRGWVMIGFSDSPEFKSRTGLIDTGDGPATLPERLPWSMLDGATSTEVLHHDPTGYLLEFVYPMTVTRDAIFDHADVQLVCLGWEAQRSEVDWGESVEYRAPNGVTYGLIVADRPAHNGASERVAAASVRLPSP
jgi:hypothetical protein